MGPGNSGNKRRIALSLQYDGTCFSGWQRQKNLRTVQGEVERALGILLKEQAAITASGRTDTGVHALQQVVHFDTSSGLPLKRICLGLNGILPFDVSVDNVYSVRDDFSARFNAVDREYRYVIYNAPMRSPFMINRAMWVIDELDVELIKKTSGFLIGEMDFASFCKKTAAENMNTVRRINRIDINRDGRMIYLHVNGNAFLHNMIRIIAGTLVEMNLNGDDPGAIKTLLEKKDRDYCGTTAPAYGLYLYRVNYNPPLESMESAF
ncbi:MAG: tRNA pseudouridine(38-40) synthase TruA [Spirochaetes bacterium]|jgi:tRNA pseudouridine38-40 synthase|nr:tRNA pseudouridine(38-40) synthase TruA [Spirochaetota bacterium]